MPCISSSRAAHRIVNSCCPNNCCSSTSTFFNGRQVTTSDDDNTVVNLICNPIFVNLTTPPQGTLGPCVLSFGLRSTYSSVQDIINDLSSGFYDTSPNQFPTGFQLSLTGQYFGIIRVNGIYGQSSNGTYDPSGIALTTLSPGTYSISVQNDNTFVTCTTQNFTFT